MKKYLLVLTIIVLCGKVSAQNIDEMIRFIKQNPQKTSLYLIEDGKTVIDYNSSQLMPLASAVKTIVAIEFARQCGTRKISPTTLVAVRDLNRYYIPNTDGGAQPRWLQAIGKSEADTVTLIEVAKGMIRYSSNANTEFLLDLLGLSNVNRCIKDLGLKSHQPIYYFTAAALMVCLKPSDMEDEAWISKLNNLSTDDYHKKCLEAHQRLKTDPNFIKQFDFSNLSENIQRVWSDRLVSSTTATYAQLMQQIVRRESFKPEVQTLIESIMEWPMTFAGNQAQFKHLGQKGGSTAFVLTDAFYGSLKNGAEIACSFFFNGLSKTESVMVNKHFGALEALILTDPNFRKKLAEYLTISN